MNGFTVHHPKLGALNFIGVEPTEEQLDRMIDVSAGLIVDKLERMAVERLKKQKETAA